jgi:hypothetical protein
MFSRERELWEFFGASERRLLTKEGENMWSCDQCSRLTDQLYRANGHLVSLILQHDRIIRGSQPNVPVVDGPILAHTIERAEHTRGWVAQALMSHCAGHHVMARRPDNAFGAAPVK